MYKKILAAKWQILALAGLALGLFSARGGVAAFTPLLKVLIPAIGVFFVFKLVKQKFLGAAGEAIRKQMEAAMQQAQASQGGAKGGKTINLCSKCGSYLTPGHRCKKA